MGLDLVELIMEVEDRFGFSIPDGDFASLNTAGKLHDYIMAHRFQGREVGCLTSVTFYRLRRGLMSVLDIARNQVRPAVALAGIIPIHRRTKWADLQHALGLRLPELIRPPWVKAGAMLVTLGVIVIAAIFFGTRWVSNRVWLATLGVACLAGYTLYQMTKPLAVEFGPDSATVGDLTSAILKKNYAAISDECGRVNEDEVWETLCTVISEQLGVARSELTKETDFVRDLGCD